MPAENRRAAIKAAPTVYLHLGPHSDSIGLRNRQEKVGHGDTMAKRKRMKKGIKTIFVLIILICLITGGLLIYNNYFKSDTEPVSSEIEKLMQVA